MSSLCKHTCDAIKEQKPILTAINQRLIEQGQQLDDQWQQIDLQRQQMDLQHQQLDEHYQQTAILRQQNQDLIQQIINLTLSFSALMNQDCDNYYESEDKSMMQYLANNFGSGAVEESKDDHLEDQPRSTSSSLWGNILIIILN